MVSLPGNGRHGTVQLLHTEADILFVKHAQFIHFDYAR